MGTMQQVRFQQYNSNKRDFAPISSFGCCVIGNNGSATGDPAEAFHSSPALSKLKNRSKSRETLKFNSCLWAGRRLPDC